MEIRAENNLRKLTLTLSGTILSSLLIGLVGCGGGSGSTVGLGGSSSTSLFVTDNLSTTYDSVWITAYQVDLTTATGSTTIFSDPVGYSVNVRALNDGQARYMFLSSMKTPAGSYTGAKITLSKTIQLYLTGATTATTAQFPDSYNGAVAGQSLISISFPTPESVSGTGKIALDFDLANWNLISGKVVPVIKRGDKAGIDDPTRHDANFYRGTISALTGTAPTQTFTLTSEMAATVNVTTNDKTVLVDESGSATPTLTNGQALDVKGKFDSTTNTLVAEGIHIKDPNATMKARLEGLVTAQDAVAGTVTVNAALCGGFAPTTKSVTVQVSDATQFFDGNGKVVLKPDFFAALTAAGATAQIDAQGTYVPTTSILTATKVKIDADSHTSPSIEVEGLTSKVDATAKTFSVLLHEWHGWSFQPGFVLPVVTNGATLYFDHSETPMTSDAFWAAVANGLSVDAKGQIAGGVLTATKVGLRGSDGHGGDGSEARGTVSVPNLAAGTFSLKVFDASGFTIVNGTTIPVQTTATTKYFGHDHNVITKAQFFAGRPMGETHAEISGTWDGTTFTMVGGSLRD